MRFQSFFNITFTHAYLNGGRCPDLYIEPTNDCSRLMKNNGFVFNNNDSSNVSVYAPVDEKGKLLAEPKDNTSFSFFVFLLQPGFVSYTKLPARQADQLFLFTNVDENNNSTEELKVSIMSKQGVNTSGNRFAFGLVKIVYVKPFNEHFALKFEANDVTWKYYLVANSSSKKLLVDGSAADISFKETKGTKVSSDKVYNAMVNTFPNANISLFESEAPISYQQLGRKNIRLVNSDKSILIDHLPNPGLNENGIKIINTIN